MKVGNFDDLILLDILIAQKYNFLGRSDNQENLEKSQDQFMISSVGKE